MKSATLITDKVEIGCAPPGVAGSGATLPPGHGHSATEELLCLSRFVAAVSSTLDPEVVCAAAARELYSLSPFQQIVFRLNDPSGTRTVSFSPGVRQEVWTEERNDAPDLVPALTGPGDWRGCRQVVALSDGLGTMEIVPGAAGGAGFSDPLRCSLLTCLSAALHNAIEHCRVKELAMVDPLTGLLNRRAFDEMLSLDGRKELLPLSLLLIDMDDFKVINDTFGHPAGDEVLICAGRILKDGCRGTDVIARFGGEEFAVLLPTTLQAKAEEIGRRLLRRLAARIFVFDGRPHRVTASIGLATLTKAHPVSVDDLVAKADQALYQAKRAGKNRVVAAASPHQKDDRARAAGQGLLPGI